MNSAYICIQTLGLFPQSLLRTAFPSNDSLPGVGANSFKLLGVAWNESSLPALQELERASDGTEEWFRSNGTEVALDACWRNVVNDAKGSHVTFPKNNTACIVNLPSDLLLVVIEKMTAEFTHSVIECFVYYEDDDMGNYTLGVAFVVVLILSMVGLLSTVVITAVKGLSVPSLNLSCLCVSHLVHYVTGVLNMFNVPWYDVSEPVCLAFGFTRNFTILSTFFWLNVMSFDIWYSISHMMESAGGGASAGAGASMSVSSLSAGVSSRRQRRGGLKRPVNWKRFAKYSAYAWGMSLFVAGMALAFDRIPGLPRTFRPNYRRPYLGDPDIRCTMSGNNLGSLFLFNTGPRWVVLMANVVFFVLTSRAIHQTGKQTEAMRTSNPQRARYRLYIKLFIVMGLAWALNVIEFIVHAGIGVEWVSSGAAWFSKISDFVTALIGIGIYITFGLMPTIAFARRRCGSKSTSDAARHTSTSTETGSVMSSNKFGMYGTGRNASTTSTEGSVRSSRLEMDTSHLPTF